MGFRYTSTVAAKGGSPARGQVGNARAWEGFREVEYTGTTVQRKVCWQARRRARSGEGMRGRAMEKRESGTVESFHRRGRLWRLSCEAFERRVDLGGFWVVLRGFKEEDLLGFWWWLLGPCEAWSLARRLAF
jgi:hypothetical protein